MPGRTLVVPLDFSRHGARALRLARALVGPGGHLVLVHVVPGFGNHLAQARALATGRRQLERVAARVTRRRGAPRVTCRVERGEPHRGILAAARGKDAIVMCTQGRTGLRRLVIGSVAERVIRSAPVPVITFRPGRARGRA